MLMVVFVRKGNSTFPTCLNVNIFSVAQYAGVSQFVPGFLGKEIDLCVYLVHTWEEGSQLLPILLCG